jgi:anti-anti-sigma factor
MRPAEEEEDDTLQPPIYLTSRKEATGLVISLTERSYFDPIKLKTVQREVQQAVVYNPSELYVLDMAKVEFISSGFLAMMVDLEKKLRTRGIRLRLCALQPAMMRALEATGLNRRLDIRVDLEDALSPI